MYHTKANKLTKARRIIDVEKVMALGLSTREVEDKISALYGCGARTVRRDIRFVQEKWAEEAEKEAPFRRNAMRSMLKQIVRKAVTDKQYGPAVSAANRLMELDGLKQLSVQHKVEHTVEDMTSADKRGRLEQLMAEANRRREKREASNGNGHAPNGNGLAN